MQGLLLHIMFMYYITYCYDIIWVKWENVRINWRINSISDSFEILWWAQLWL